MCLLLCSGKKRGVGRLQPKMEKSMFVQNDDNDPRQFRALEPFQDDTDIKRLRRFIDDSDVL